MPSAFVVVDALPLTPNGKLDRRALPEPTYDRGLAAVSDNPDEQVMCSLFAKVLGVAAVGANDGFFDLGGHSLLASRLVSQVRSAFGRELPVRAIFEAPTPAGLVRRLTDAQDARAPLTARQRPALVPMSHAQQRLWFVHQFEGRSATYNLPMIRKLTGQLDVPALEQALTDVVARHESLRTVLREVDGRPVQEVRPATPITLHHSRCTAAELPDAVRALTHHTFDLASEAPLRAGLVSLADGADGADGAEGEHVLVVLLHHVVTDGWSRRPLARDLAEAYRARRAGSAPDWAPLPVQYADYALWQREILGSEDDPDSLISRQLAFWRSTLDGSPVELPYPTDRPRPPVGSQRGGELLVDLSETLHAGLADLARQTGTTISMIANAALATVLTRLGAGTDITIGTPVAGRPDEALADLIGFFVNTLVLRVEPRAIPRSPSCSAASATPASPRTPTRTCRSSAWSTRSTRPAPRAATRCSSSPSRSTSAGPRGSSWTA